MPTVSGAWMGSNLLACAAYAWAAVGLRAPADRFAWPLWLGWSAQGLALVLDVVARGEARFGFATTLSATLWLVLAVHAIESRFWPLPPLRRSLPWAGLLAVVLAWVFPGEAHAAAPGASPWAPLHWLLGIASYGLFGAAVLHAVLWTVGERRLRERRPPLSGLPLLTLERLTFRFVEIGFLVLTATLLLGVAFTTAWRWDHKTVFSVLSWAVFAALLVGRYTQGWRGRRATHWLYSGVTLLLLAYVGSRFVLEVVLHRGG